MFLSSECHQSAVARGQVAWHPKLETDPAAFLSSTLDEIETGSLTVIEWPPSASCFPREAEDVRRAVTEVVRRHQASLLTEGANGRRWLSNLVRNFSSLVRPVAPRLDDAVGVSACVIAAAGPSLEEALDTIARMKTRISLWVTGSALDAVLNRGLEPDLVISTDAAFYASEYLRARIVDGEHGYPIAAPLTASRGIGDSSSLWPLSYDDPLELMIYGHLSMGPTSVPAHGTVAGTAIHLAVGIQRWPVVVAGMDFAWHGSQSHARPHVSEIYRDLAGSRLTPPLTEAYRQSLEMIVLADGWRTNGPLQVYARWFDRVMGGSTQRLHRLCPSPTASAIPVIDAATLSGLPRRFSNLAFQPLDWPDRVERRNAGRSVTEQCLRALRPLTDSRDPKHLSKIQIFLLRRFAVDGLIRWHRTDSPVELRSAVRTAEAALSLIGEFRQ
jgi:hypothetical protein